MSGGRVEPLRWKQRLAGVRPQVGVASAEEELSPARQRPTPRDAVEMADAERRRREEAEERTERFAALVAKERAARVAAEARERAADREARAARTALLEVQGDPPRSRPRRRRLRVRRRRRRGRSSS